MFTICGKRILETSFPLDLSTMAWLECNDAMTAWECDRDVWLVVANDGTGDSYYAVSVLNV